ncbi:hypothetical protein HDV00_012535, partial [Rhizophlyctis rosea]
MSTTPFHIPNTAATQNPPAVPPRPDADQTAPKVTPITEKDLAGLSSFARKHYRDSQPPPPHSLQGVLNIIHKRIAAITPLLPDILTRNAPILLIAFIFSPKLFGLLILAGGAFLVGWLWNDSKPGDILKEGHSLSVAPKVPETVLPAYTENDSATSVAVPPRIDVPLNRLLDHFIRDFISNWYDPYDVGGTPPIPRLRTLIPNPPDLRSLSTHLALRLLPKQDRASPVAFSFAREILATTVLLPMIETFSDPDWINQKI